MDRFDNPVWQSYYSIYMPEKESILEKLKKTKTKMNEKRKIASNKIINWLAKGYKNIKPNKKEQWADCICDKLSNDNYGAEIDLALDVINGIKEKKINSKEDVNNFLLKKRNLNKEYYQSIVSILNEFFELYNALPDKAKEKEREL